MDYGSKREKRNKIYNFSSIENEEELFPISFFAKYKKYNYTNNFFFIKNGKKKNIDKRIRNDADIIEIEKLLENFDETNNKRKSKKYSKKKITITKIINNNFITNHSKINNSIIEHNLIGNNNNNELNIINTTPNKNKLSSYEKNIEYPQIYKNTQKRLKEKIEFYSFNKTIFNNINNKTSFKSFREKKYVRNVFHIISNKDFKKNLLNIISNKNYCLYNKKYNYNIPPEKEENN